MHQLFLLLKRFKLLCKARTVTLALAQLKLQMQFSYKKHRSSSSRRQEKQTHFTLLTLFSWLQIQKHIALVNRTSCKGDKDVLLTTELFPIMRRRVHAWHRFCFALEGWQTHRHSNAEVWANTRQTDCQHSGLITVSVSPVSIIPWHSSLQEILCYATAFLTFMYSVIPVIHHA